MIIGVISDTHGLLRPEALEALRGSDVIINAGDVGSPEIIPALHKIAPVLAIRGNVDVEPWARKLPVTLEAELEGVKFFVIHNRAEIKKVPKDVRVVVFGHSHQPLIATENSVLFFNPGSAGPRRFKLPISVGRIRITNQRLFPELIELQKQSQ
jgi:putative phosphoesterase